MDFLRLLRKEYCYIGLLWRFVPEIAAVQRRATVLANHGILFVFKFADMAGFFVWTHVSFSKVAASELRIKPSLLQAGYEHSGFPNYQHSSKPK